MTDHVAFTLDGANTDFTLGVNAMRWAPTPLPLTPLVDAGRWV